MLLFLAHFEIEQRRICRNRLFITGAQDDGIHKLANNILQVWMLQVRVLKKTVSEHYKLMDFEIGILAGLPFGQFSYPFKNLQRNCVPAVFHKSKSYPIWFLEHQHSLLCPRCSLTSSFFLGKNHFQPAPFKIRCLLLPGTHTHINIYTSTMVHWFWYVYLIIHTPMAGPGN